jgi:beta-glucosidase
MKRLFLLTAALCACTASLLAQEITPEVKARAAEIVSKMTLEEKIGYISGDEDGFSIKAVPGVGLPQLLMADGPQGVRNRTHSTLYPCGVAAAASWNRDAAHLMGQGIGRDARARGVAIMLGPGVNIYRSALNGRNFEYFGEDPYLASETALQYILGMQEQGVIATIKHFALNNSEFDRHGISSVADERTMNEIYFETFRKAVEKGKVGAIMTSYNMVNGQHAPENSWLIKENLREKWGFEGIVMSDWVSTYSTLGCFQGGLDLEMPRPLIYKEDILKNLLANGVISEAELDEKVQHIVQTLIAFGFLEKSVKDTSIPEDSEESRKACYDIAVEAPVLLKNEGALPLKGGKKNPVVVLGPMTDIMPCGGGSGEVHPIEGRSITIKDAVAKLDPKKFDVTCLEPSFGSYDLGAIRKASAVVVAVGYTKKTEGEGHDREFFLPDNQDALIEMALDNNRNVIVVVVSGGEVDMSKWQDRASAILMAWYDGQDLGTAVTEILTGKVVPSGKLPFTCWGTLENNPAFASYHPTMTAFKGKEGTRHARRFERYQYTEYSEGVFLGYRGAEHFGLKPLYPFGYGLSYTTFDYADLAVTPSVDGFDISFTVRNTGKVDAKEVAEVYIAPVDPKILRPARELKEYQKVFVPKGGSASVKVHLDLRAFSFYDVDLHDWAFDSGRYRIEIGRSSEDIVLSQEVTL